MASQSRISSGRGDACVAGGAAANLLTLRVNRDAGVASTVLITMILAGCQIHQPPDAPTTRPSLSTTQPSYWLSLPAAATNESSDFEQLWKACDKAARHFGFVLDRLDRRMGVITTQPLISKQFFELWRPDVATADDLERSSLATYRRTLRFQIQKLDGGRGFRATPSVLIERQAVAERPIVASIYLRQAFRADHRHHPSGTPESDQGILLPQQYWYPTGRDTALEKQVAENVQKRLRHE